MTRLQIAKRAKSSVPLASVDTRRGLTPGQVSAKCLLRDPASSLSSVNLVHVRDFDQEVVYAEAGWSDASAFVCRQQPEWTRSGWGTLIANCYLCVVSDWWWKG